jgi:hypothetical protein
MTNTHRELRKIWVSFWEHLVGWRDDRKYSLSILPTYILNTLFSGIRHSFFPFFLFLFPAGIHHE